MEPKIASATWQSVFRSRDFKSLWLLSIPAFILLLPLLHILSMLTLDFVFDLERETGDDLYGFFLMQVGIIVILSPALIIADIICIIKSLTLSFRKYKGKARLIAFAFVIFQLAVFLVVSFMGLVFIGACMSVGEVNTG